MGAHLFSLVTSQTTCDLRTPPSLEADRSLPVRKTLSRQITVFLASKNINTFPVLISSDHVQKQQS